MAERHRRKARKTPSTCWQSVFLIRIPRKVTKSRTSYRTPEGDGNCLPRALSIVVYGTEDCYKVLRNAVCNFILSNVLPSESSPRDNKFYIELAKLWRDKVWMGTREVEHTSKDFGRSLMKIPCHETLHGVHQYYGGGRKNRSKKIRIVGVL